MITENDVVNLSAVINLNDEFIDFDVAVFNKDQASNYHFVGEANLGSYKLGSTLLGFDADGRTWFTDQDFTNPLDPNATIDASNYVLTSADNFSYPQVKYYTTVYSYTEVELTEYTVSFSIGGSESYYDVTCSFEDEYCDLSGVPTPTKDGYVFAGWKNNYSDIEFNEHLVNHDLEFDYINFEAVWTLEEYTINFYDGNNLLETLSLTYGGESDADYMTAVNRGSEEAPRYYFIEGWSTSADSTEIAYETKYDFTHLVTDVSSIDLYAVVDEAAEYVDISWGILDVNQDDLPYFTGLGADSFYKYGEKLDLARIEDRTWYSDENFNNEIEDGLVLNDENIDENYDFIIEFQRADYPQVTKGGIIYGKDVTASLASYTLNFYDIDNTTILKTVDIEYNDGHYYGMNNSLPLVNGISGWSLYIPEEDDYSYQYDYHRSSNPPHNQDILPLHRQVIPRMWPWSSFVLVIRITMSRFIHWRATSPIVCRKLLIA